MSGIYHIYKVTNKINGKSYIGFTSKFSARKSQHKCVAFNPKYIGHNYHFYRAIRKYGWNEFSWDIIYSHWDREYCMGVMEPLFIKHYDTYPGYNMTPGGDSPMIDRLGVKNHFYGKKHTNETKYKIGHISKIRNSTPEARARISSQKAKNYIVTSPNGDEFKITNLTKFCRENNLNRVGMTHIILGKQHQHRGYKIRLI